MLTKRGRPIIISSVSGGGKTTIIKRLREMVPGIEVAVTATSRKPREGEVDGIHYYFYTKDEFEKKIQNNDFLEYALVYGDYKGVPADRLEQKLQSGISVILNIDVQGMRSVLERMHGDAITVFVLPPDNQTWEKRLRSRGTDSEEEIRRRLEHGLEEMEQASEYRYCITNDDLDRAVQELMDILKKEGVLE